MGSAPLDGRQRVSPDPPALPALPPVMTHLVTSRFVSQTFKVQVGQPVCAPQDCTRAPVLYVTDGNLVFDTLRALSYGLHSAGQVAPFIVVGIGYPSDFLDAGALLRGRDMTFPGYPRFKPELPLQGVLPIPPADPAHGGAAAFLQFLSEELFPLIENTYRALPGHRAYFGHSLGAGFGLYTVFERPGLFQRFLLSSPGLSFDGTTSAGERYDQADFMQERARAFANSGLHLPSLTTLYLSVGTEEEFEPDLKPWRLTSSAYRMAAFLQSLQIPNLQLHMQAFPGETHATAWPLSFMHGVRTLFPPDARSRDARR